MQKQISKLFTNSLYKLKNLSDRSFSRKKINVLCLDGGGTRGVISLKILQHIEKLTQQRITKLFDVVYGVSTGSIIATGVFAMKIPLADLIDYYLDMRDLWSRSRVAGFTSLIRNGAFYDSQILFNKLKKGIKDQNMVDSSEVSKLVNIGIVSSLCGRNVTTPFIFRNFISSRDFAAPYEGSSKYKWIDAVRASTATPGIFEKVNLGGNEHIDGGIGMNNPSYIAFNEIKHFFPNSKINAFVSLGTGKSDHTLFETKQSKNPADSQFKTILQSIVQSATRVEDVSDIMADILPSHTYFRLNPLLPEVFYLNEGELEQVHKMIRYAGDYVSKNAFIFSKLSEKLLLPSKSIFS